MKPLVISAILLLSSPLALASNLDNVLNQVRIASQNEIQQAQQQVDSAQQLLNGDKQRLLKAKQQLADTNKRNIALEDRLLALQQKIKQRRQQYQAQRESISGVFEQVEEHGELMLQRTSPHGLWQFDTSGFTKTDAENIDTQHIRQLWLALTEQIVLTSKIQTQGQSVVQVDGTSTAMPVTHIGPFNAYSQVNGTTQWLNFLPAQQQWQVMNPQPSIQVEESLTPVDLAFGQLLQQQALAPSWWQKLAPAGIVGVFIGLVALIGVMIAAVRFLALRSELHRIRQQVLNKHATKDNALGRVILATENADSTHLEAAIDEAVLKEIPKFKTGVGSLAVFSTIPPLLGLLGTVGGMIKTFEIITLHGSADSELLSGGISEALLTTELGLMVAIPLLLLHCGVKSLSTKLIEILEQQSAGIIVRRQQGLN